MPGRQPRNELIEFGRGRRPVEGRFEQMSDRAHLVRQPPIVLVADIVTLKKKPLNHKYTEQLFG